jgi:murein L,D-transpeptidase YafK
MKRSAWFVFYILLATDWATGKPTSPTDVHDNAKLPDEVLVDSIAVHKSKHEMEVFHHGHLLKIYKVQLGTNPVGPKRFSGDGKTPEGLYYISGKNAQSLFHKSLEISYPNQQDVLRAAEAGKHPGGDIMIHGLPNGEENVGPKRYRNDWTLGCIAVRNGDIDELFEHVGVDVPILITP